MKIILSLIAVVFAWSVSSSVGFDQSGSKTTESGAALRTVKDGALISNAMPAVQMRFAKPFKFVGSQNFILYDVANAEQHFFVDADKQGRIKRLYWVQFEGYLPNNSHSYKYKADKTVNIGGLDFIADANSRSAKDVPLRPDSDGSRARAFLERKGYRFSDEVLVQRLVHLVDEAKRNELMIIYLEDMTPLELTAADVSAGGRAAAQWNQISKDLLARTLKHMQIVRNRRK